MNALCTLLSIVKARYFAAPLKFLIRGSCAVSFTREKKKSWKQEFCSLPRYFSFHPFRSRLPVVSLNDEASPGLLRLLDLVQLFTTPPYPPARPKRNSGSSVLSTSVGRIFSERYCKNRRSLSRFTPSQVATLRHPDRLPFFARHAHRFQLLPRKRKHLTNLRNKFCETFLSV